MSPELIVGIVLGAATTLYLLFGGADFGAGIWEINTAFQSNEKERKLLYHAIGPVWEANHIWLIFVLVVLFAAFPLAFQALCSAFIIPAFLVLVGIVFRGAGYVFRAYSIDSGRQQQFWRTLFAGASAAAPFFLGAIAGTLASGDSKINAAGVYEGNYLTDWITPMALFTAFFTVGLCCYLAAVFLTREAEHSGEVELTLVWRQRALATGIWMGVLAAVGLVFVSLEAPELAHGFATRAWPLVALSAICGTGSLLLLLWRKYTPAAACTMLAAANIIWGWGIAQYPVIAPPFLTLADSKAPDSVLWAMIGAVAAGAVILGPSLALLFYLFKLTPSDSADY
ncbi:cytochrome d ubiquinol oxidase subunit II [Blastopirellula marina]|nr:cytochrome d ubiquinol oxidase subunit II [Blastopirellula marina]